MVLVEIYINRKAGDKDLPEKITIETDSGFLKRGEIIEFPPLTIKSGNYTAIKIIEVTKQVVTGLTSYTPKIVVHAERYY